MANGVAVREAVSTWAAGIIVGGIPLGMHGIVHFYFRHGPNESEFAGELLFFVITTSGASIISVISKLISGKLSLDHLGRSLIILNALMLLLLAFASLLYAGVAGDALQTSPAILVIAFAVAAALLSAFLESSLAATTA